MGCNMNRLSLISFGMFPWICKAQVVYRRCPFFLSATPFCYGIITQEESWIVLWDRKYEDNVWLKWSLVLSLLNVLILTPNCVWRIEWKMGIIVLTSCFCLRRNNHVIRVPLPINVRNQRSLEIFGTVEGPLYHYESNEKE